MSSKTCEHTQVSKSSLRGPAAAIFSANELRARDPGRPRAVVEGVLCAPQTLDEMPSWHCTVVVLGLSAQSDESASSCIMIMGTHICPLNLLSCVSRRWLSSSTSLLIDLALASWPPSFPAAVCVGVIVPAGPRLRGHVAVLMLDRPGVRFVWRVGCVTKVGVPDLGEGG